MPACLIGLGSNLQDRHVALTTALTALDQTPGMHLVRASTLYETKPVGGPGDQSDFLNSAALFETTLAPLAILRLLQHTEDQLGRVRTETWGPRTIDLDLLLYDKEILDSPSLTLPHPRMACRRFVLEPAAEVAVTMVHPTTGWTIQQLLDHLNNTPRYLALAGGIGVGKTELALRIAQQRQVTLVLEELDTPLLTCFYNHPARHAKRVELEFLRQRTELLWPQKLESQPDTWTVSDFWFNQSAAFARVWLDDTDCDAFLAKWERKRHKTATPRLVVFLDPPLDRLIDQVVTRGRSFEQSLSSDRLEAIHRCIAAELQQPDVGPVLHLTGDDPEQNMRELLAAIDGME